jgi:hypothetical protein
MEYTHKLDLDTYKQIDVMYNQHGKISPLQRWNDTTIDLDKLVSISDCSINVGAYSVGTISDYYSSIRFTLSFSPLLKETYVYQITQFNYISKTIDKWIIKEFGLTLLLLDEEERTKFKAGLNDTDIIIRDSHWSLKKDLKSTVYFVGVDHTKYKKLVQDIVVNDILDVWRAYKDEVK